MYSLNLPDYTAVIRTLGTAGQKYQILLDSLVSQTHPPKKIIVYLAEGYEKPKETIGIEEIVCVKKGMVAQRALPYDEVDTEWMLCLDDDIKIEPFGVEALFKEIIKKNADGCAVDLFPHDKLSFKAKIGGLILLSSIPRLIGKDKGYTINILGTDCYNPNPKELSAWSTTNAAGCFLCRKKDFLKIHFEEDLWLDSSPYAIPEDTVMFYKMHLNGLKILTYYGNGFEHLDASTSIQNNSNNERLLRIAYSHTFNTYLFDHLYVLPNLNIFSRIARAGLKIYLFFIKNIFSFIRNLKIKQYRSTIMRAKSDAKNFLKDKKIND